MSLRTTEGLLPSKNDIVDISGIDVLLKKASLRAIEGLRGIETLHKKQVSGQLSFFCSSVRDSNPQKPTSLPAWMFCKYIGFSIPNLNLHEGFMIIFQFNVPQCSTCTMTSNSSMMSVIHDMCLLCKVLLKISYLKTLNINHARGFRVSTWNHMTPHTFLTTLYLCKLHKHIHLFPKNWGASYYRMVYYHSG